MPVGDLADGGHDSVDLRLRVVVRALHVPDDHGRAAILGDLIGMRGVERRAHVLDRRIAGDRVLDVFDRRTEGGILDRLARALNEHELCLGIHLGERLLEDLVGLVCLADVRVRSVDVLRSDEVADHDCGDNECEPAEDCCLPVARAPATHAGRDVVRALQG